MPRNNLSREVVVLKATQVSNKDGLQQLTLKKLAEELDVKTPALYNHIKSLAELHVEMALYGLGWLEDRLSKAAVGKSGDDAVLAAGRAYLAFAKEQPGLYEATQWTNIWNNDPRVHEASDSIISLLELIFSGYEFDEVELCNTIRLFRSFCHGFASLELNHGFGNTLVDPVDSFEVSISIILEGLRMRQTA